MPDNIDPLQAFLERQVRQILEELATLPPAKSVLTAKIDGSAYIVTLSIIPGGTRASAKLTPCERDILVVLSKAVQRMTGPEILAALLRVGIRWSEVTLWRSLAHLAKLGYVHNQKKSPQGYRLIASPLPQIPA